MKIGRINDWNKRNDEIKEMMKLKVIL
jgi:hypothetical protein